MTGKLCHIISGTDSNVFHHILIVTNTTGSLVVGIGARWNPANNGSFNKRTGNLWDFTQYAIPKFRIMNTKILIGCQNCPARNHLGNEKHVCDFIEYFGPKQSLSDAGEYNPANLFKNCVLLEAYQEFAETKQYGELPPLKV